MSEAFPETIQDNPRIRIAINHDNVKISSAILHIYNDIVDVRQNVSDEFNIAIEEQIIKHRGRVIGNEEIVYAIYKDPAVDIEWKNPLSLIIKSDNFTQGGIFYLSVPRSANICFLLELISFKINLKYFDFYLIWSGTALDSNKSISDYNIQNKDVLEVHVRGVTGMMVYVKYCSSRYRIVYSPYQYVRDFKKSVCNNLNIQELKSICLYLIKPFEITETNLEDAKLMGDYDIQPNNTLLATNRLRGGGTGVSCMYKSHWMGFNLKNEDRFSKMTIRELKEKISKEIEKPMDKFTIKYNRTEFTDLNKTLKQYLIDDEMILNIEDKY